MGRDPGVDVGDWPLVDHHGRGPHRELWPCNLLQNGAGALEELRDLMGCCLPDSGPRWWGYRGSDFAARHIRPNDVEHVCALAAHQCCYVWPVEVWRQG